MLGSRDERKKILLLKKKKTKKLTYCQSLNLLQPEGFPKPIHHLYAGTRYPSGIGLNESIPNEEISKCEFKTQTFYIFITHAHIRLNEKKVLNPVLTNQSLLAHP